LGTLEIVGPDRLQPRDSKLRRDVFGGDIQASRGRIAPFEQIRRKERQIAAQGRRADAAQRHLNIRL
jgi:hypothetical protein